jgi:hypothetical protein
MTLNNEIINKFEISLKIEKIYKDILKLIALKLHEI